MTETRRTVTVVFADVSGSTALGEQLDPEALRRVMERYFAEARTALERHGGTVEKFIGDAVVAVFGIPAAHEDDALRAGAAREMQEALANLIADLEERGVSFGLRTGINTGEVVRAMPPTASSTPPAMPSTSRLVSSRVPHRARSSSARRLTGSSATRSKPSLLSR